MSKFDTLQITAIDTALSVAEAFDGLKNKGRAGVAAIGMGVLASVGVFSGTASAETAPSSTTTTAAATSSSTSSSTSSTTEATPSSTTTTEAAPLFTDGMDAQSKLFVVTIDKLGDKDGKLEVSDIQDQDGDKEVTNQEALTVLEANGVKDLTQEQRTTIVAENPEASLLFTTYDTTKTDTETGSADTSATDTDTAPTQTEAEKIVADIIKQTEDALVRTSPGLNGKDKLTQDEAHWIATTNANNFFKTLENKQNAEKVLQKEVSKEVEAQLKKIGLTKEDVTPVTDSSELAGPRETGQNSFNHGKAPTNSVNGLEQSLDILNARNGFTKADQAVAVEALRKAGVSEEAILIMASGDLANVKINLFTLNSPSATYKNIAFNANGKLAIDDLRAVNEKDAFVIVSIKGKDGKTVEYAGRFDCSGLAGLQIFESIEIDHPAAPAPEAPTPTPAAPVEQPPATPTVHEASASVCTGLDENGKEIIETFKGHGETAEEAQENANLAASVAAGNCTTESSTTTSTSAPATTTSTSAPATTTSTSAPATTTSTSAPATTTTPPKNPTETTIFVPSTTVPVTEPQAPVETRPPATVANNAPSTTAVQEVAGAATFGTVGSNSSSQASLGLWGAAALSGFVAISRKKKLKKAKKSL